MEEATAIRIAKTRWWTHIPLADAARIQLREPLLIMDFSAFHEGVEKLLGRPVWTHEFVDPEGLLREAGGITPTRTLQDVLDLIPEEKRIVVEAP